MPLGVPVDTRTVGIDDGDNSRVLLYVLDCSDQPPARHSEDDCVKQKDATSSQVV